MAGQSLANKSPHDERADRPPTLNELADREMAALIPVGAAELAEHLRSVIQDVLWPHNVESVEQAQKALDRFDRQALAADPPPWLRKRDGGEHGRP